MALKSPLIVHIPKPASISYGQAMSEQRAWLDRNKIEPSSYRPAYQDGVIGFEIGFKTEDEATLFDRQFG
jgi:hypothetical protein